ncbi:MAG TPA: MBL fold metallo-hydrolase [Bryobacteraceae bacterium]|nr:MBL fold metallo-hydrolase [Bryobacteraceae bacterium]
MLADMERANSRDNNFRLWWLGQSGFLVQWQGRHLLLDPYLSDSLTAKYASTDKPHVRMTERAIDPARLNFVDVMTSSHNHTDHLDGETLTPLLAANPRAVLVIPEANRDFVADRLHIDPAMPVGLDDGLSVDIAGFHISGVPAAHDELERDEQGRHKFLGFVVRFGSWTIYHSGDTLRYDGMADKLRPFGIDLALLPINGRAPERRVPGNLSGREAAQLAHDIGAKLVIPCHYEMFEFNTASPNEFVAEAAKLSQPYRLLRCGERWDSRELAS